MIAADTRVNHHTRWALVVAAWSIWGLVNTLRLRVHLDADQGWSTAFWYGMPDAIIWAALTPIILALVRRLDVEEGRRARALGIHLLVALVLSVVHSALDAGVSQFRQLFPTADVASFSFVFRKLVTHATHLNLLVYFLAAGIAYYFESARRLAARERRESELRSQLTEARLQTLQAQLRPHFLFNALHTVSSLVRTDPSAAQRVIRQLGDLLRTSLKNRDQQTISLREELALVESYLAVESTRFGGRLSTRIEAGADLMGWPIPTLILQPLVENVVHHGLTETDGSTSILIRGTREDDRLVLEVRDDGPGLSGSLEGSNGLGLVNTRSRLRALYGDDSTLAITESTPHGVRATLKIPRRVPA